MLTPSSEGSNRIDSMLRRDIAVGVGFALSMWVVLTFTFFSLARVIDDAGVRIALAFAGGCLGILNTLALTSLIGRYRADREAIYSVDLHYLDLARGQGGAKDSA